jgi:hypothetical protein
MDIYRIIVFVHLFTLLVAAGATAIMKLAITRRTRARTVGDVLDWHNVLMATSKVFPMCLAAFVITGGYMVSVNRINAFSTGFVVAGLVGVAFLLVSGIFLGTKGKALGQMLEGLAKKGADQPAPKLAAPPFIAALPIINTFVALSVAFDMVTKPTSVPIALSVVAVGIALGAVVGMRPAATPAEARAAQDAAV